MNLTRKQQVTVQNDRNTIAFNQGGRAFRSGIKLDDCQHEGSLKASWQSGWKQQLSLKNKIQ